MGKKTTEYYYGHPIRVPQSVAEKMRELREKKYIPEREYKKRVKARKKRRQ